MKSFAEVVGKTKTTSIPLKAPVSHCGEPAMFLYEDDITNLASPFQFALVGKFSHSSPSLLETKTAFETFWFEISIRIFFFVFLQCNAYLNSIQQWKDYHQVWLREQMVLKEVSCKNFQMVCRVHYCPNLGKFSLFTSSFFKQGKFIFNFGNTLGKPMKRDAAATDLTRPIVARVCIEMDILKKFHIVFG